MSLFYNPANIKPFIGKTFVTLNPDVRNAREHRYSIDYEGRFRGRSSLEGSKVDLVAGIEYGLVDKSSWELCRKETWDAFVKKYGRNPPKPGLSLVVSVAHTNPEYSGPGLFSSPIQKIFPYPSETSYYLHIFKDGTKGIEARNNNYNITIHPNKEVRIIKRNSPLQKIVTTTSEFARNNGWRDFAEALKKVPYRFPASKVRLDCTSQKIEPYGVKVEIDEEHKSFTFKQRKEHDIGLTFHRVIL